MGRYFWVPRQKIEQQGLGTGMGVCAHVWWWVKGKIRGKIKQKIQPLPPASSVLGSWRAMCVRSADGWCLNPLVGLEKGLGRRDARPGHLTSGPHCC